MADIVAVRALRQKLRDARVVLDADAESGGLKRTTLALDKVHFVTTGGGGDVRILMSASRKLVKVALRPGTVRRYERVALGRAIRETIQEAETTLQATLDSMKDGQ